MTMADWLTLSRAIVSPFVFILVLSGDKTSLAIAFVLFGLGAISDFVDGYIARRTKISHFGKLWDPIADKLLTGFTLISLSTMGILYWWITGALILRDVVVTTLRLLKLRKGAGVILPVLPAKLKTTFELIMLSCLLFWVAFFNIQLPDIAKLCVTIYASIVVLLSWGTGLHYIFRELKEKREKAK
jgi:CDP-diacylglycerol---glycerol-3-phosphate 3-phosphatidyltransferase